MAVSCGVLSQCPDVWSIAGGCSSIRTVEERIPAAQHEEAVDSGKTVGDTDGADIGIRLGSLRCGITYPSTGFVRREPVPQRRMRDASKAEVFAIATEKKNRRAPVVAVAVVRTEMRGSLSQRVFPLLLDRLAAEMHDAVKLNRD